MRITTVMTFLLVLGELLAPMPARAQGCSMCYTSAEAAGPAGQRALDFGILILLIPTLLMFVGIIVFAVRRAAATN